MLLSLAPLLVAIAASLLVLGLDATFWLVSLWSFALLFAVLGVRIFLKRALPPREQGTIAFFHPNANGGGGGERVLWCAIKAIQTAHPKAKVAVYTTDGISAEELRRNAQDKFGIIVPAPFEVIPLEQGELLLPERWPRFTMLGQALGSLRLAYAALRKLRPQVFVDTSGWALAYPLVRLAGAKLACYVHYPAISTNMLLRVAARRTAWNNARAAASLQGALAKLAYYHCFACLYGAAGGCANVVTVNSSWTRRHVRQLWWKLEEPRRVWPPCGTRALQALPLERKLKRLLLVSLAQFRPEKRQGLQLRALAAARAQAQATDDPQAASVLQAQLVVVGGCRGPADEARLEGLRQQAAALGLQDVVEFRPNASAAEVRRLLGDAVGGLHSMRDEHFGISIVEYMAAGVVPIAHNSGGPREDIVTPPASGSSSGSRSGGSGGGSGGQPNGFLCDSVQEYADAITRLLCMAARERRPYAAAARRKAEQFSDELFEADFLGALQPLLALLDA